MDARYAGLVFSGYEGYKPPFDAPWSPRYAMATEPDGNQVGLTAPSS